METLKQIQELENTLKTISVLNERNTLIRQIWGLQSQVSEKTHSLKRGELINYLDAKTNKIKQATVVSQGKYVNDYNDTSNFVRIKNATHSWNESREHVVKA